MLKLKPGVKIPNTMPDLAMSIMKDAFQDVYASHGLDCVITSIFDGKHGANTLHQRDGIARAMDFRISNIPNELLKPIVFEVKEALGPDFDIVLEKDHIHGEWDPKPTVTKEA